MNRLWAGPLAAACELWPLPSCSWKETGPGVSEVARGTQAEGGGVGTTAWTQHYPACGVPSASRWVYP